MTQNVSITGSVTLNGHYLLAQDSLTVSGTGTVVMTNPADTLWVTRTATFGGGDETGKLTAGRLMLEGDFINPPSNSASSFAASGSLVTVLYSASPQRISFAYPLNSHFQDLDLNNNVLGVTLATAVTVQGVLMDSVGEAGITGNGNTLTVGGTDITLLTLDHVLLHIAGPDITAFDNVTFQNYAPTDTQLSVATTGSFSFTGLTFKTAPTTGWYVSANNSGPGLDLTIQSNLTPAAGAARTQLLNGATVAWQ